MGDDDADTDAAQVGYAACIFVYPNAAVNSEAEMFYEVAFVTAADGSVALIGDEGKSFHGVGRLVGEWRTVAKVRAGNCRG